MAPTFRCCRLCYNSMILCLVFIFCLITQVLSHVGQPCNKIIKLCLASNSYCDHQGICRCKHSHPVNVSPHTCKKGSRYGEQCSYTEECIFYDNNTYCTQLPYRSTCECHDGFLYSEEDKVCKKIIDDYSRNTNSILPTAIGLSLAFASVLCCILVLWHICRKQSARSHWSFTPGNNIPVLPTAPNSQGEPFLHTDESLPNYDAALSLKSPEECEPPPSYDEVIEHMDEPAKA